MTDTPQRMTAAEAAREFIESCWWTIHHETECKEKLAAFLTTFSERVRGEQWREIKAESDGLWTGNDVLLTRAGQKGPMIVAFWCYEGTFSGWQTADGIKYPLDAFNRWQPLPSPPTTEPTRTITESEKG